MTLGRSIVALLAAGLLVPAAAHAAPTVTVVTTDGKQEQVDLATMPQDIQGRSYTVRSSSGTTTRTVTGVSLRSVLLEAKGFEDQPRRVEIADARQAVLMSRKASSDQDHPAVFVVDAAGVQFLRDSVRENDLNGDDLLLDPANLTIRLLHEVEFSVTASASDATPAVDERTTLRASVAGAGAGDSVRVSWTIEGKRIATGATLEHTFRKPGTYVVLVTATAGDDFASATVRIAVPKPEAEKQPETTTTTTATAPAPATSAPPPASGDPGTPSGTGSGASGGTAAPSEPDAPAPQEPAPAAADTPRPGELRGRLIETVPDPVTPVEPAVVREAPDAGDGAGGGGLLPPAAWTGIGVCLFLLAGWGLERTGWRPRPWHRGVTA